MTRRLIFIAVVLLGLTVQIGAQTFPADIQQFWNQLRTGAIAFSTGRVQTSGYLNFGNTVGTNGYGFRDLSGTMQFKDSGGAWSSFPTGGLAPAAATYLLQTANASLPNAQAIGALATGLMYGTTTTGVLSAIVCGTSGTVLIGGAPPTCSANPTVNNMNAAALNGDYVQWPKVTKKWELHDRSDIGDLNSFQIDDQNISNQYLYIGTSGTIITFGLATQFNLPAAVTTFNVGAANSNLATFKAPTGQTAQFLIDGTDANRQSQLVLGKQGVVQWAFAARNTSDAPNNRLGIFNAAFAAEVMTIIQGGTVGINQSSPSATYKLDVNGAISGATYYTNGSGMAVANVGANSCGTTTATIAGNSNAFVVTVGATAATQCRVAFPVAATTEYDCAANDDTTTVAVRTTPVDTTHTDLIGTFTAGDKVTGICFPR